jgi:O-antigen/teichoic acid export membrane protein
VEAVARPLRIVSRNSAYLISTTAAGSLAGYIFWIMAARMMSTTEVGQGAALISALTLLAAVGDFGMGVTVIRFAARERSLSGFLSAAFSIAALATLVISGGFLVIAPVISPAFATLRVPQIAAAFVVGAATWCLGQLLDRLFVAFERTRYVLVRSIVANASRLAVLPPAAALAGGSAVLAAVSAAAVISLAFGMGTLVPRLLPGIRLRPTWAWRSVAPMAGFALTNHAATLLWSAPPLVFPIMVASIDGPGATALFYVAWMMANLLLIVPAAVTTTLLARAANQPTWGNKEMGRALVVQLVGLVPAALLLIAAAPFLLAMFGDEYVVGARNAFAILCASVVPYAINMSFMTSYRISRSNRGVMIAAATPSVLATLAAAWLGALESTDGFAWGWLLGQAAGSGLILLFRKSGFLGGPSAVRPVPG